MQQFILSTYKLRVILPLTREVVAKVLLSDPLYQSGFWNFHPWGAASNRSLSIQPIAPWVMMTSEQPMMLGDGSADSARVNRCVPMPMSPRCLESFLGVPGIRCFLLSMVYRIQICSVDFQFQCCATTWKAHKFNPRRRYENCNFPTCPQDFEITWGGVDKKCSQAW